ncbi:MAG: GNAT family N-acetyltransferase [Acidimicrobiia bacterium]|nr:GNAT family N-acetyltransferase [Acidimicrobiia bacterium]
MSIRAGRPDDAEAVASFTQGTFSWGDYVGEAFPGWLEDPALHIVVATDEDDRAVGVMRTTLTSPREAWLASARVHPDHRGRGLATEMNEAGVAWAGAQGAVVARLLIEDWNEGPQRQVERMGYHKGNSWSFARRDDLQSDPNPLRNGGPRVPGPERLLPAAGAEVDDAFLAWSSGRLLRASRGLVSRHWAFWTLRPDDLVDARRRGALLTCPSGWVIGDLEEGHQGERRFSVTWLHASAEDSRRVLRACLDHAVERECESIALWLPVDAALDAAHEALGFEASTSSVWERPIR